jgi:hypothetical protein
MDSGGRRGEKGEDIDVPGVVDDEAAWRLGGTLMVLGRRVMLLVFFSAGIVTSDCGAVVSREEERALFRGTSLLDWAVFGIGGRGGCFDIISGELELADKG